MVEANIIGETLCPWCSNELEVVKSPKSGYHYANCTACNAHFRNIPIALVDMKGKETPQAEPEVKESALERLRREYGKKIESGDSTGKSALERIRREFGQTAESEVGESALERLRRRRWL